jgi:hypothetical protein
MATLKLTKSEQEILEKVRKANSASHALHGLCICPSDPEWNDREHRFVKRLSDRGLIVWVESPKKYGKGWCVPELVANFAECL